MPLTILHAQHETVQREQSKDFAEQNAIALIQAMLVLALRLQLISQMAYHTLAILRILNPNESPMSRFFKTLIQNCVL